MDSIFCMLLCAICHCNADCYWWVQPILPKQKKNAAKKEAKFQIMNHVN